MSSSDHTPTRPARIAVLISGHGTNLQAIIDAVRAGRIPNAEVCLVVSNRKAAYGMERARAAGIPVEYFPLKPYRDAGKTREEYDADLADLIESYQPDWIVLAGWMHILSMAFIRRFPGKIVNLHPALPGQFPGTNSIQRAWEAYQQGQIRHTGLMVHLVPDEGVDEGPVILERCIPINPEDSVEDLEERVHRTEHEALPEALRRLVTGEVAQPS
ncbi:MAG: phosphoribosylglycinamide formyltransferase [Anaerolineae bacterium]